MQMADPTVVEGAEVVDGGVVVVVVVFVVVVVTLVEAVVAGAVSRPAKYAPTPTAATTAATKVTL